MVEGGNSSCRSTSEEDTIFKNDPKPYDNDKSGEMEFSATENQQILSLARTITHRSQTSGGVSGVVNSFLDGSDPSLDPSSPDFSAEAWTKNLLNLSNRDPNRTASSAAVSFRNLGAYGYSTGSDYQKTVPNVVLAVCDTLKGLISNRKQSKIQILRDFDGLVREGEMCVVLGRPGSGCTTFLKSVSTETYGFHLDDSTHINYQGVPYEEMAKQYRGEVIYNAETEAHFPHLSVGETLQFAALARTPRTRLEGLTREQWASHMRDVLMAMLGLSHTVNTKVGDDYVRGVSGGERKRVSIAEAALSGAPYQFWDNSTRGLDSATALEFCHMLRRMTKAMQSVMFVSLYQASQASYDVFDKVIVLYEGRQIYFGPTVEARQFFKDMGFDCPDRQTTSDFLTSLTSPAERTPLPGFELKVPKTPDEFAERWRESDTYKQLIGDIEEFNSSFTKGGEKYQEFVETRNAKKSKHLSPKSPFTLSMRNQINICTVRGFQRLKGDYSMALSTIFGNTAMALIISSIFFNLPNNTGSFYSRGALLFFAILMNAFSSALEIFGLYVQRPIVEKHNRYAFYHPFCEAIASMICDLPTKFSTAIMFNLTLYFMSNLRRSPGHFFCFFLISVTTTFVMSSFFRTVGAFSKTLQEAMPFAALLILILVIYTGFTIPISYMHPWFRWLNYLDPIAFGFEALMINEFQGRRFPCSTFVPSGDGYTNLPTDAFSCTAVGSINGESYVLGTNYIIKSFSYHPSHLWRNFGILIAFFVGLTAIYLFGVEFVSGAKSKGEILIFKRDHLRKNVVPRDLESSNVGEKETIGSYDREEQPVNGSIDLGARDIFQWKNVVYEVQIKTETRRILSGVDGWVQPGKLTALMGASGAGKTTLLDVLADRVTMGVVTGDMLVNGHPRNSSFQRNTGYVQQQDLHLATSTVKEALTFSALLRQPKEISKEEKLAYVDEVIKILEMEEYAEAVVGVPGEGLNVEQRKRLTIGVELAAKPELLLFLDEPTSGLDSQTAWSICSLMRKLANNGQAILCTIHQPSAMLFQQFDKLLFMARGGRTVYFGDIGENSRTMIDYFERNGSGECPKDANPAEWMLEVIGAAPGSHANHDYHEVWLQSPEREELHRKLDEMAAEKIRSGNNTSDHDKTEEFAAPFGVQLYEVLKRTAQQYWRTPSYIYSKFVLTVITNLFIGFSFWKAGTSQQGLQNQMFALFMMTTVFGNMVQQIIPTFVTMRSLYEVRERPSKTYSWQSFLLSNIMIEIFWQTMMSVAAFFVFYYPIGLQTNAGHTGKTGERGILFYLLMWTFYVFSSTFANMIISGMEDADTSANIANLMFSLCLLFCGVMSTKDAMPGFWIFMYRVSPFTYLISALLSTAVANAPLHCASKEFITVQPAKSGQTCSEYFAAYMNATGGYLQDGSATSDCKYCTMSTTNQFLATIDIKYGDRWRNFGLMIVYIIFNICAAFGLYWFFRVPKKKRSKETKDQN